MKARILLGLAFVALVIVFLWLRRFETGPRPNDARVAPPPAKPVEIAAARDALPIGGVVVDRHGAPVHDANVALRSFEGRVLAEKTVTTGADGRFTTSAVAPARYSVLVWPRNSPADAQTVGLLASNVAEGVEAGNRDVRIELAPAARARGVVRDASDRGIERAHVIGKTARGVSQSTTVTGKDGAFELVLPLDEDCTLEVRLPQLSATPKDAANAPPLVLTGVRGGVEGLVVRAP